MNWLNIEIRTLTSQEFLGSDPVDRATWLCLMRYCAQQENGGRLFKCEDWKDRRWQQLIGVTKQEIEKECDLWEWIGNGLKVWSYPEDKEAEVRANRLNGKRGGRPKVKNPPNPPKTTQEKPFDLSTLKPSGITEIKPSGLESVKRKGRERKGKEGNNTNSDFTFPEKINTPEIKEAMQDWIDLMHTKGKSFTDVQMDLHFKDLLILKDTDVILESIKRSIKSGYKQFYEPHKYQNKKDNEYADDEDFWKRQKILTPEIANGDE